MPDSSSNESKDENKQEDNEQQDTEQQDSPPQPVGFWDSRLKHVRHEAFFKWTVTTVILMTFIIAVLSLYWGALSSIDQNLSTIVVYVVDFDGRVAPYNTSGYAPVIGPTITRLANQALKDEPHLGYQVHQPSEFNFDPIQVRQAVYNWDAWAAIIINANATALLQSAVTNGNVSYDPLGVCQLIFTDSRDDTIWYDFIAPVIQPFMTEAVSSSGTKWAQQVLQNATSNRSLLRNMAQVPQALTPAVGFSEYNLRPFYPYTAIPAVSIGLIYLIIISFFSFSFYLPIHFKVCDPISHSSESMY